MVLLSSLSLRDCAREFRQVLPAPLISATVAEPANHDFPCPAWKIAIGSPTTSALAAGSTSCSSLFRQ